MEVSPELLLLAHTHHIGSILVGSRFDALIGLLVGSVVADTGSKLVDVFLVLQHIGICVLHDRVWDSEGNGGQGNNIYQGTLQVAAGVDRVSLFLLPDIHRQFHLNHPVFQYTTGWASTIICHRLYILLDLAERPINQLCCLA